MLEYLLGANPGVSATALTTVTSRNVLHCVVKQGFNAAMVRLLCSRYPAMMLQRDSYGKTPLFNACWSFAILDYVLALCEAGGREVASAPVFHPTDECNGWLPLHAFVYGQGYEPKEESLLTLSLSPWADTVRLLLRLYPEAAGVEAGDGRQKKTPYQLAVDKGLPAYYRRLLLRAAPALDPAELRRLNWAERRVAMFVAFKATFPKGPKLPLLARFRLENHDVLKHVVSFI